MTGGQFVVSSSEIISFQPLLTFKLKISGRSLAHFHILSGKNLTWKLKQFSGSELKMYRIHTLYFPVKKLKRACPYCLNFSNLSVRMCVVRCWTNTCPSQTTTSTKWIVQVKHVVLLWNGLLLRYAIVVLRFILVNPVTKPVRWVGDALCNVKCRVIYCCCTEIYNIRAVIRSYS